MTMMTAVSAEDVALDDSETDSAVEAFDKGSAALEVGQYGEAFTKFQGAIRALKQEKLDQDVRSRLKFGNFGKDEDSKQKQDNDDNNNKNDEEDFTANEGDKNNDRQNEADGKSDEDSRDKSSSGEGENATSTSNILPEQLLNALPVRFGQ